MPHRYKKLDASDEAEIRSLLSSLDQVDREADSAVLQMLRDIINQPDASNLSPDLLHSIQRMLAPPRRDAKWG